MHLIQTSQELKELCETIAEDEFITVDTEFIRENTFYPEVCLIQVGGKNDAAAIDPLAHGLDLSPFFEILANDKIVKVFHAGRQDLEIFYALSGQMPRAVFDTQIAAMVCGFGESVSYQNLCSSLLGVDLDKSQRFTDWSRRPLQPKQVEYALCDVTYLRDIYVKIKDLLGQSGRAHWVDEEMADMAAKENYEFHPEKAFAKLKSNLKNRKTLNVLRELAYWREVEAERTNRPRRQIISDDFLTELAKCAPNNGEDLFRIRGIQRWIKGDRNISAVLAAVKKGKAAPSSTWAELRIHPELPKNKKPLYDLLHLLLAIKAEENDVAAPLIASGDDLTLIATAEGKDAPKIRTMEGWRYDIFGKDALALKAGNVCISYDAENGAIKIKECK